MLNVCEVCILGSLTLRSVCMTGQKPDLGEGHTFFWSEQNDFCKESIGFAVKNKYLDKLAMIAGSFNDRLMSVKLPTSGKHKMDRSHYSVPETGILLL